MQLPRTSGFANSNELLIHFGDHAQDFSASTLSEYEAKADYFLTKPKTNDMHECPRKMGDRQRFDMITNEFGVISSTGVIRTYFVPKKCSEVVQTTRRIKCHRLPTHLDYAIQSCNRF